MCTLIQMDDMWLFASRRSQSVLPEFPLHSHFFQFLLNQGLEIKNMSSAYI